MHVVENKSVVGEQVPVGSLSRRRNARVVSGAMSSDEWHVEAPAGRSLPLALSQSARRPTSSDMSSNCNELHIHPQYL